MSKLEIVGLLVAGALLLLYLPAVLVPERYRTALARFPRSRLPARILTAIDVAWAAWLVNAMPMGRFDLYKPWLLVVAPVLFVLIVAFMDDLLAPRALGGLLVLLPAPLLDAVRWQASPWRLVLVVLAYILVGKGMVLLLSPYWFGKIRRRWLATGQACRVWGMAGSMLAVLIGGLALFVY